MKNNNNQHVQVPHLDEKDEEITPKDQLVYACIRRYMNKDTKEAFPSLETLHIKSGASIPTIRKSIKNLENNNYLKVTKKLGLTGKIQNVYKINTNKCEHFEMFSYDFLDKEDINFTEKAYILASQQFMYKDNNLGKISLSDRALSKKINMSKSTISKCNHSLVGKNYLQLLENNILRDPETGCLTKIKVFDLESLGQALVCAAIDHEQRISNNTEDLNKLKNIIEKQSKDIEMLKKALFTPTNIIKID